MNVTNVMDCLPIKKVRKKHVKSVHKGLKYNCDMCEVKFSQPGSVSKHKKNVHFKATVYGAKTLTETIFSMMIESNSGWRCVQCGKESKNKGLLKMHIESEHMGISHTCEMCGHTYKTKCSFRNHFYDGACKAKSLVVIDSSISSSGSPSFGQCNQK